MLRPRRGLAFHPGLAALLACGLALLPFPGVVLRGEVFFSRDLTGIWIGQVSALRRVLAASAWPLWNPWLGFGQPLLANPTAQVAYPPSWLTLVLPPWTAYALLVLLHAAWGAFGVYRLSRALRATGLGATTAAAIWTGAGPVLSLVDLWNHQAGVAWLPWAVLGGWQAARTGAPRALALAAVALAAQVLAGSPESALMSGVAIAVLVVAEGMAAPGPRLGRPLLRVAAAGLLALGLAAVQWVPALQLVRQSARSTSPESSRLAWSLHPARALEVLAPVALDRLPLAESARAELFDGREAYLASVHLGLPVLLLAGSALCAWRPQAPALAVVGALAGLLALGRHTPWYGLASAVFPPLHLLRYPVKAMVLAALVASLLAGAGVDAWRRPRPWQAPLLGLGAAAGLALAVIIHLDAPWSGVFGAEPAAVLAVPRRHAAFALLALAALLAAAWAARRGRAARRAPMVLAALAAVPLHAYHFGFLPTAPDALYRYHPPSADVVRGLRPQRLYVYHYLLRGPAAPAENRWVRRPEARPLPAAWADVVAMRDALLPPLHAIWGLEGSFDPDVIGLVPDAYRRLVGLLRAVEGTPRHLQLLQVAGVSHVLAMHREGLEELQPVAEAGGPFLRPLEVLAVPDSAPRARVVHAVRTVPDRAAAVDALRDPSFDVAGSVAVAQPVRVDAAAGPDVVEVVERAPDRVVLRARLAARGLVVLDDAYDDGWRARVDGAPAAVLPADGVFRAVEVGAGDHHLELRYRPPAVLWGAAASAVALAFTLILAGRRRAAAP